LILFYNTPPKAGGVLKNKIKNTIAQIVRNWQSLKKQKCGSRIALNPEPLNPQAVKISFPPMSDVSIKGRKGNFSKTSGTTQHVKIEATIAPLLRLIENIREKKREI
jgi:hypothetical protein